jgi:hypothetical protein
MDDEGMAWFFMGEGTIDLRIRVRAREECIRPTLSVEPTVRVANTDGELIRVAQVWCRERGISFCLVLNRRQHRWNPVTILQISQNHVKKFLNHVGPFLVGAKNEQAKLMVQYFDQLYHPSSEDYGKRVAKQRWFKILELSEGIFRLRGWKSNEKLKDHQRRIELVRKLIDEKNERAFEPPTEEILIDLYWNQGLSRAEIGERYGASETTVVRWMRRRNVPARSSLTRISAI